MSFNSIDIMDKVPSRDDLSRAGALLNAVYGWDIAKIKNMSLDSVARWIKYAKKKMTWGDAYKLHTLLQPRVKKTLWQKIRSKINF